jgi:hypothetical protein
VEKWHIENISIDHNSHDAMLNGRHQTGCRAAVLTMSEFGTEAFGRQDESADRRRTGHHSREGIAKTVVMNLSSLAK